MYLPKSERKAIMDAYGCGDFTEDNHYQVRPDTWVYLFHSSNNEQFVLISADYLDYDFDHFPQLLRFNDDEFRKIDFILQKEMPSLNPDKTANSALFGYTD